MTLRVGTKRDQRNVLRGLLDQDPPPTWEEAAPVIEQVVSAMHNRRVMPVRRVTSPPLTPEMRAEIRRLYDEGRNQQETASLLGTNIGRVNNTLIGVRR